jgi:hypothetical protein
MASLSFIPFLDRSKPPVVNDPVAKVDLEDLQDARRDPRVHALLDGAAADGSRVEHEAGRKRW